MAGIKLKNKLNLLGYRHSPWRSWRKYGRVNDNHTYQVMACPWEIILPAKDCRQALQAWKLPVLWHKSGKMS